MSFFFFFREMISYYRQRDELCVCSRSLTCGGIVKRRNVRPPGVKNVKWREHGCDRGGSVRVSKTEEMQDMSKMQGTVRRHLVFFFCVHEAAAY